MSIERPDCDMSDVSVSESSWADAQADTPTMGDGRSDSEDTLSNLSFDNDIDGGVDIQVTGAELPLDGSIGSKARPEDNVLEGAGQSHAQPVNVRVQVNDFEMDEDSLQLNLPPGTDYKPPSVDFPTSPSQLKISKGPSFMPTEEPGVISEDESSVNSYRAHLGLNGDVRLSKRDEDSLAPNSYLRLPTAYQLSTEPEPDSLLLEDVDGFDDYIEDFFNPLSNEPVMQRATSFRRKVQKTFEDAVIEKSIKEINNLEAMLSAYDDTTSIDTPDEDAFKSSTPSCGKCASFSNNCPNCVLQVNKFLSSSDRLSSISRSGVNGGATIVSKFNGSGDTTISGDRSADSTKSSVNGSSGYELYDANGSVNAEDLERRGSAVFARGSDAFADRRKVSNVVRALNFEDMDNESEPQSLLDIDAIVRANAPNLMNSIEPQSLQILHQDQDESSNYFLPKDTITKIESVFDSSNFTNLYTLSGELKHILSPSEIEEIVANKEHLETILSPNIMAALSWSLNDASLPPYTMNNDDSTTSFNLQNNLINSREIHNNTNLPIIIESSKDDAATNCFSSATSLSNGFHSKESSLTDVSDQNELEEAQQIKPKENKKMVPVKDSYGMEDDLESKHNGHSNGPPNGISNGAFQRGTNITNSFRRKISLGKQITSEDLPQKYVEDNSEPMSNPTSLKSKDTHWKSLESLDDLEVEDEIDSKQDSENGDDDAPKMILVRRDSKRFNKGDAERVIQGFFIESKNTSNGTLRRIKVPLNIDEFADTPGDKSLEGILDKSNDEVCSQNGRLPDHDSEVKTPRSQKKKISVDDNILSTASELEDNSYATDATQSDVFHSIINSPHSEDKTIQSDGDDEDVTLDIDTPDDMEESILEQLESIATTPVDRERIPELLAEEELEDERRWKSFRVGASDIQIDLKAIQPYRRVLSHGGYLDAERKVAIILFSGCYLPDRSRKEYSYLMDHLFLYVLSSLEELIVEDYILVYLHGATPKSCMPTFGWLKRCYQLIDHRLRKNLKGLYLVHPTFWLKTVVALTKPFVSGKFSRKLEFVNTLADLCLIIPTEHLVIPDRVLQYDAIRQELENKNRKA